MISQLLVLSDFITSFLLRDHLCFHSTFSDHIMQKWQVPWIRRSAGVLLKTLFKLTSFDDLVFQLLNNIS